MDSESRSPTGTVGRVSAIAALPTAIPFERGLDWLTTGEHPVGVVPGAAAEAGSSPDPRPAVGHAGSYR